MVEYCADQALLNALSDLFNRITPVFAYRSVVRSQITTLRNQLIKAEEKNRNCKVRSIRTESKLNKTLDTAAQATQEFTKLREEVQTLKVQKAELGRRKKEYKGKLKNALDMAAQAKEECTDLRDEMEALRVKKVKLGGRKKKEMKEMKEKVRNLVDKVAIYESKVRDLLSAARIKEAMDQLVTFQQEKRQKARIVELKSQLSSGQNYAAHLEKTSPHKRNPHSKHNSSSKSKK